MRTILSLLLSLKELNSSSARTAIFGLRELLDVIAWFVGVSSHSATVVVGNLEYVPVL